MISKQLKNNGEGALRKSGLQRIKAPLEEKRTIRLPLRKIETGSRHQSGYAVFRPLEAGRKEAVLFHIKRGKEGRILLYKDALLPLHKKDAA